MDSVGTVKAIDQNERAIVTNEKYSVRQFTESTWGGFVGDTMGFLWPSSADLLPRWGTLSCDVALRMLHMQQQNAIWSGAAKIWIERILGTPYEISGGRNLTFKWQDLFFESDFGEGYDFLMSKFLADYLTLNRGGFIEKVSYGATDTPIREGAQILGLNHLDALRIVFTGNREIPFLYRSEITGELHKLHHSRVIHLAESPSPDTRMLGVGKSALYDAVSIANSQIMLGRHQNEMLNDLPPPGIVIFNNVKADEVATAMEQFDLERIKDGQNLYRAPLQLSSKDPSQPATVQFVPLSTTPEGFDYEKFMLVHVNVLALVMQLDPQDIWPLHSVALGSGQQSKILEQKTTSKGPGYLLTRLERAWNLTLPRSLEWKYKAQNAAADLQQAQIAEAWSAVANSASYLTKDEQRQLVANQVSAVQDVLLDETGQIRLFDADPKTPEQLTADDAVLLETAADGETEVTANSQTEDVTVDDNSEPDAQSTEDTAQPEDSTDENLPVKKDIDATGDAFVSEIQSIMEDALARTVTKAGAGSRIRGAIQRYGKAAYIDGLAEGGVDAADMDEFDLLKIADLNVEDSVYVSNLVKELYSEAGLSGTPETRAKLWISTLNKFYYAGVESGDKNGLYMFTGKNGADSCHTCQTLNGQVHRMKDWVRKQLIPGKDHDSFECGSWEPNCKHYLKKTTGKAKGNWV